MDVPPSAIEHEWHAAIRIGVSVSSRQSASKDQRDREANAHTGVNTGQKKAPPWCEHEDFEYQHITKSNRTQKAGGEPRLPFPLVLGNGLSRGRG